MANIGNVIISAMLAILAWYPVGLLVFSIDRRHGPAAIAASLISFAIFCFLVKKLHGKRIFTATASKIIGSINDVKDGAELNRELKNANYYAQAEDEYDRGEIDKGLWSQALVNASGDESLRKVEYMKLRAKQLKRGS
jgi:hypothetical protein